MKKQSAAKGRRAVALLLLLVMCLGNVTPALAQEITETGAAVYTEIVSGLEGLLDSPAAESTEDNPESSDESDEATDEGDQEAVDEEDSEDGVEDPDDAEDTDNPDDREDPDGSGEEETTEDPDDQDDPETLPEELDELENLADLLDATPATAKDLDELIEALTAQNTEISLTDVIVLDDQSVVNDLNTAIANLIEDVTITVANDTRHFLIKGDVTELNLGNKVILDGGDVAGGIEINYENDYDEKLTVTGGVIQNCQAELGGGMYVVDSQRLLVSLVETQFIGNSVTESGKGAGYYRTGGYNLSQLAETVFHEVRFIGNDSTASQTGTIEVGIVNRLTVENSDFKDNKNYHGVFTMTATNSRIEMTGGSFTGNRSSYGGAAIYFKTGADSTFSDVTFTDNSGGTRGAFYAANNAIYTFNNCTFKNNAGTRTGGAISVVTYAGLVINGGYFEGNEAGTSGGAVYHASKNTFDVSGAVFRNNFTTDYALNENGGGAIAVDHTTMPAATMSNCEFYGNHTASNGGALMLSYNSSNGITFAGEFVFKGNSSNNTGGAVYIPSHKFSTLSIDDDSEFYFRDNVANGAYQLSDADREEWESYPILTTNAFKELSEPFAAGVDSVLNNYDFAYTTAVLDPQFQIKYDPNGATGDSQAELLNKGTRIEIKEPGDLNYTFVNHLFTGWNTAVDGSDDYGWYQPGATHTLSKNLTLYAQWAPKVDLTFWLNAPGSSADEQFLRLEWPANTEFSYDIEDYEHPQLTGYRFAGWATEDGSIVYGLDDVIDLADEDLELYARWVKTLTIRYFDGDTQLYTDFADDYEGAEEAVIRDYPTATGKYAYIWKTGQDSIGAEYAAGNIVIPDESPDLHELDLYIQWTKLADYLNISRQADPQADYGILGWYQGEGSLGNAHTYFTLLENQPVQVTTSFQVELGELTAEELANGDRQADVYLAFEAASDSALDSRTVRFMAPAVLATFSQENALDEDGQLQQTLAALRDSSEADDLAAYDELTAKGFSDQAVYLKLSGVDFAALKADLQADEFTVTSVETIAAGDVQFADGVAADSQSYDIKASHYTVNLETDNEVVATGYTFLQPELGLSLRHDFDPATAQVGEVVTVTVTAENLSNIGLENLVFTILKGNADAAVPFAEGILGALDITYTPSGSDTDEPVATGVEDHRYTFNEWYGSLIPAAYGEEHENGVYTITFTYTVQEEDLVDPEDAEDGWQIPFYLTLTGETPAQSLDQQAFLAGADYEDWYVGADLATQVSGDPLYAEVSSGLSLHKNSLTYDANGGIGGVVTLEGLLAGGSHQLLNYDDARLDFDWEYHEFLGWTLEEQWDGEDETLLNAPGTTVAVDGATYYAQWKALNYPVTYVLNPDPALDEEDAANTDEEDRYVVGEDVPLKENIFTVEEYDYLAEYTFLGWALERDWDGDEDALYQPGDLVPMAEEGLFLYAQWQRLTYRVTYDANHPLVTGENSSYLDATAYTSFDTFTVWDNPFAANLYPGLEEYEFLGWTEHDDEEYDETDLILADEAFTMGSRDRTFFARWNRYTYSVTYHSNYPNGAADESRTDETPYGKGDPLTLWAADTYTAKEFTLLSWNTAVDGSGDSYLPGSEIEMGRGNLVLYAQWSQSEYSVTYDSNSAGQAIGVTEDLNTYIENATIIVQENGFVYSGYTFTGWNTRSDGEGLTYLPGIAGQDTLAMRSGGITLYAQWEQNQYNLSYDHNHEDFTAEEKVLQTGPYGAGDAVVLAEPVRTLDGYWFLGWSFSAENSENEWLQPGRDITMPDEALTLYAQWQSQEINEAAVVYHANDGSGNSFSEDLEIGAGVIILSSPFTREEYIFLGWNTKADGSGIPYDPDDEIEALPPQGLELYAQWQQITYPLTFLANEAQYPGMVVTGELETAQLPKGSVVTMPESPYRATHYTFLSWNTEADGSGETYLPGNTYTMADGAATFYAQWRHDVYTVTYESGYAGEPAAITDETNYEADAVVTVKNSDLFARDGYAFAGWALTAAEEENELRYDPQDEANNSFVMPAENVTLYARWDLIQYALSYDVNDSGSVILPTTAHYAKYDVVEVAANTHSHTSGLQFLGWNTKVDGSGTWYRPGEELTILGDVTLYAQWDDTSAIEAVIITYEPNGADSPATAYQLNAAPESTLTVWAETNDNLNYVKADYLFIGWNTGANGEGTWYAPEASLEVPYFNVTLYAQWEKESRDVIYLANRFADDTEHETTRFEVGASFVVAGNPFTNEDYHFIGWNTAADGSDLAIAPGQTMLMGSEDILLYAQWEENTYTLTFDSNRGDGLQELDPERYAKGRQLILPGGDLFAYDDVIFLGWSLSADAPLAQWLEAEALFTMPAEDVTFYAQWKDATITTSTITYLPGSGTGVAFAEAAEISSKYALRTVDNDQFTFTKLNSEFAGWNTKADGTGVAYDAEETISVPIRDLELYAQWEAVAVTVSYNANDDSEIPAEINETVALGGDHVTQDAAALGFEKTGSRFLGFNTEDDGSGSWYQPGQEMTSLTTDITLYAIYSVDSGFYHPVLYSANADYYGWDRYQGSVVDENNSYRGNSTVVVLKNGYTKEGYRFLGWSTKPDGTGDHYVAADEDDETLTGYPTFTMVNKAVILYAQWEDLNPSTPEPETFTVTYDANGGSGVMSDDTEYETGDIVTVMGNLFTREGYDFVEFNTADDGSGTGYQADETFAMGEQNVILFAIWEEQDPSTPDPDTLTVIYEANGGTGTMTDDTKYKTGAVVTVLPNSFVRDGYDFVAFNTAKDGSGINYQAGETFTIGEKDVILFALWKEQDNNGGGGNGSSKRSSGSASYTITYRSEYSSSRPTDGGHKKGASVALKAHSLFTDLELPEGVEFKGWSLTGSNGEVDYAVGDRITIDGNITLYAVYSGATDLTEEEEFTASPELESRVGELLNLEEHQAYISGYPDGTVRPEANITREEVTAIFYRLLNSSAKSRYESSTTSFSDVESGRWSEAAIATMHKASLVAGDTDGAFRPGEAITRAEAAVIAARFTSGSYTGANQFTDISNHWAASYINAVAAMGWMSGDGNGSFRPDDFITRAEMMAMLNNMLQRSPRSAADLLDDMETFSDNADPSAWYYLHVQEATNSHAYEKSSNGRETWTELRP